MAVSERLGCTGVLIQSIIYIGRPKGHFAYIPAISTWKGFHAMPSSSKKMMMAMTAPALAIQTEGRWRGVGRSWVGRVDQNHIIVSHVSLEKEEDDDGCC